MDTQPALFLRIGNGCVCVIFVLRVWLAIYFLLDYSNICTAVKIKPVCLIPLPPPPLINGADVIGFVIICVNDYIFSLASYNTKYKTFLFSLTDLRYRCAGSDLHLCRLSGVCHINININTNTHKPGCCVGGKIPNNTTTILSYLFFLRSVILIPWMSLTEENLHSVDRCVEMGVSYTVLCESMYKFLVTLTLLIVLL